MSRYYVGVDVGSGSVRAGIFNSKGQCLARADQPIEQFRPQMNFVEQSSENIWSCCVQAVRAALKQTELDPLKVVAIGFDATCSLVAVDEKGRPVSVSPDNNDDHNVIMWMDHRAIAEAQDINATGHDALTYVGGEVSPEMELPKLLWLKRHRPDQYARAGYFFDLADYMVFRATGYPVRSQCTLGCKWNYLPHDGSWPIDLLERVGLEDLLTRGLIKGPIQAVGSAAGQLTSEAALALGLSTDTLVATGIIDAHAGTLGMLGPQPEGSLNIIAGTSACHIAVSPEPIFVSGVWGPYWGAVLPDAWINEGGQSAVGSLIEHIIRDSAVYDELKAEASESGKTHYELLNAYVDILEAREGTPTRDVHVLGYHHGNRSPRADPSLKGMITGATLEESVEDLARRYLATLQSIAYGTRHIVETMNAAGHYITQLRVCGGALKNPLWLRELADATGLPLQLPAEPETVLLGSAMLGAAACGDYGSLREAAGNMFLDGARIEPRRLWMDFHEAKYRVFLELYEDQMKYRKMMQ